MMEGPFVDGAGASEVIAQGSALPDAATCPIRDLIARLGDKWSILVLMALDHAPEDVVRFSALLRAVSGISPRMLAVTLRQLERDGIVGRNVYAEVPPRVEYHLTERGRAMQRPVSALVGWIAAEWPAIERSRREYDKRNA